ncbi:MAG TPA: hypothetical protein VF037_08355 [Gemmatimonadales bacterium]
MSSGADGQAVFDRLSGAFEAACAARPDEVVERTYRIAGAPVRLRVAGRALADAYDRPMSHLRTPPNGPARLTVELWDESATGIACEGCVEGADPSAPGTVTVYEGGRHVRQQSPRTVTVTDRPGGRKIGWVSSTARLTQYELGRPLHSELLLWMRDRGIQAVHAGLVARGGVGVLFGGPGGSGKTTTAVTSLRAGFQYLADDYVGLERQDDGSWFGHSLYSSSHFEPHHLERFPDLLPHAMAGRLEREDKHMVLLSGLFPGGFADGARIAAVALPRVAPIEETRFRPASKVEVLRQLAPSSLFQLPYGVAGRRSFDTMVALVESVPTWWLELGRDLDSIPRAIGRMLNGETR